MFLTRFPLRIVTRQLHRTTKCLADDSNTKKPPAAGGAENKEHDQYEVKVAENEKPRRFDDYKLIDSSTLKPDPLEDPIKRTHRILKNDLLKLKKYIPILNEKSVPENAAMFKHVLMGGDGEGYPEEELFPSHCDVVIIGGGAIGSSAAYYLKQRAREGLRVVVVEKDKTYEKASTTLSVGGLRQQFSLEENILMSLYAADFFRDIRYYLGKHVNLNFVPHGYLFLATEKGAQLLEENSLLQNRLGAKNMILTKKKLKSRFPWLNTDDIALGK